MSFKPMRAVDANLDKMQYPTLALAKIDGVRALNRDGKMFARTLKRFKNHDLNATYDYALFDGIDGELTVGGITDQALCRNTSSVVNSFDKVDNSLMWNAFDILNADTINLPYLERYNALREWKIKHPDVLVNVVPCVWIYSREQADIVIEQHLQEGYEGTIFRNPHGLHKDGRSTHSDGGSYWREKGFVDEECLVVSINEAMENTNEQVVNALGRSERSSHQENMIPKGMVGSLNCWSAKWGDFIVGSGEMDHEERTLFWNNPTQLVGQAITFKYFPKGVKDKPRFPTFKNIRVNDV